MDDYGITIVENLMDLDFYRMKRYSIPCTVAIIESKCDNLFEKIIERSLRKTDLFQYISENIFVIIFGATYGDQAEIAIENLFAEVRNDCYNHIYIGFTEVKISDNHSIDTIKRASTALKSAKKLNRKDIIMI